MEEQRRAERLVINLRWFALAAGALVLHGAVSPRVLLLAAALIGSYNLAAWITVSDANAYRRRGAAIGFLTRAGDLIAAGLAVWTVRAWSPGSYLILLFPIIATAYGSGRKDVTLGMVSAAVGLNTIATLFQGGWSHMTARTLAVILAQAVVLAGGGLVGVMLRFYRARESVQEGRSARLDRPVELQDLPAAIRPSEALASIAGAALRGLGSLRAGLLLKTTDGHALYVKAAASADGVAGEVAGDDPVALHVARTGQPLILAPIRDTQRTPEAEEFGEPCVCVPLVHHSSTALKYTGEILGVLLVRGKRDGARFSDDDLALLCSLAADATLICVNTTLYDRLHEASLRAMQLLVQGLEARDPYMQAHSSHVATIATTLAREMGLDEFTTSLLRHAALLHDIGKTGIPDSILCKPGNLTPEEWESIKRHPVVSEEICRPLDMPRDLLFLIRHHHERLDGSGYPDGLQSHQQPLALRILCVADAFDAMSSARPYRRALTLQARLRELNRLAGVEFDQQVAETLKRLIDQGALDALYRETAPAGIAADRSPSMP